MGRDKNQFADALTTLAFMAKIVKRSVIAYRLSDNVIEDYELLNFYFLNKDVLVVEKEEELD
jgi:signal-transduction protein with cAMP-binding, CBS, and nucleotidyltransferase domain